MNTIKGIWFDAHTGEVRLKDIVYEITPDQILRLVNGPTGYESVYIKDLLKDIKPPDFKRYDDGSPAFDSHLLETWVACVGTPKRWSRLEIPVSELRRILIDNPPATVTDM